MSKTHKPKAPEPPKFPDVPLVVETFSNPSYQMGNLMSYGREPSCFNGILEIRRYRVTAELIEEPVEVLHERLRKLWRECDNVHHYSPLRSAAEKLGLRLSSEELGKDRKRKP